MAGLVALLTAKRDSLIVKDLDPSTQRRGETDRSREALRYIYLNKDPSVSGAKHVGGSLVHKQKIPNGLPHCL